MKAIIDRGKKSGKFRFLQMLDNKRHIKYELYRNTWS